MENYQQADGSIVIPDALRPYMGGARGNHKSVVKCSYGVGCTVLKAFDIVRIKADYEDAEVRGKTGYVIGLVEAEQIGVFVYDVERVWCLHPSDVTATGQYDRAAAEATPAAPIRVSQQRRGSGLAMRILITNDDGIFARGLEVLKSIALGLSADVWTVAPETNQSGTAHSMTLHEPLRLRHLDARTYAVAGTPTDCVIMAVRHILKDAAARSRSYQGSITAPTGRRHHVFRHRCGRDGGHAARYPFDSPVADDGV